MVYTYDEAELVCEVIKSNSTEYHCESLKAWNDGSASRCIKNPRACDMAAQIGSVFIAKGRKRKQRRNP